MSTQLRKDTETPRGMYGGTDFTTSLTTSYANSGMDDAALQILEAAAVHAALQQHVDETTHQLQAALERCVDLEAQLAVSVKRPTVDSNVQASVPVADAHMQAPPTTRARRPVMLAVALTAAAAGTLVAVRNQRREVPPGTAGGEEVPALSQKPHAWTLRSVLALGRV